MPKISLKIAENEKVYNICVVQAKTTVDGKDSYCIIWFENLPFERKYERVSRASP